MIRYYCDVCGKEINSTKVSHDRYDIVQTCGSIVRTLIVCPDCMSHLSELVDPTSTEKEKIKEIEMLKDRILFFAPKH